MTGAARTDGPPYPWWRTITSSRASRPNESGPCWSGQVPAAYGEIDHSSAEVYQGYLTQPPADVLAECRRISAELIDGSWTVPDEDLLDPARNSWLNGRMLWLQIVVRGFWHPTGHLGDYYLAHGQPGRAVALQAQGLAMARYLGAPAPVPAWRATAWPARRPRPASRTRRPGRWPRPSRRTRTCGPTPAETPTCARSCEKLSPEDGPAGSLACSGTRREEFCVSCRQLRPSSGTRHADG